MECTNKVHIVLQNLHGVTELGWPNDVHMLTQILHFQPLPNLGSVGLGKRVEYLKTPIIEQFGFKHEQTEQYIWVELNQIPTVY